MLRKLIPAAILLSGMGAAQAQIAVYGVIDLSYGKNITDDAAGKSATFHSGGDGAQGLASDNSTQGNAATVVGVKGSHDVGAGIQVNFQLETAGITRDGQVGADGQAFFGRQAWAGFSGDFGEFRLGRQDSVAFQTMLAFDLNGGANAASAQGNSGVGPWAPALSRQLHSVQYISPTLSGFKAQVGFVPAGDGAVTIKDKATYSLGVSYTEGPIAVAATAETARTDAVGASSFSSVAGSYDFGVAKVMVGYADGGSNAKGPSVGVVAPVAGFKVGMNYSRNTSNRLVNATEFFVNREVFKNTFGYLDLANVDAAGARQHAYAVGVIYTF